MLPILTLYIWCFFQMYQTNVFPVDQVSKFQGDTNFRKHVKTLLQFEPQKLTQVNSHCPDFYIRNSIIYYYIKYLKVLESTCCIIFCWYFVSVFFCRRFMARLEKDEMEALLRWQEQVVVKGWSHKAAHRQVRHSWVPQLRIREHTGNWCYLMEEIWELFKNSPNTRGIECIKLPISTGAPGIFVGSIDSAALQ